MVVRQATFRNLKLALILLYSDEAGVINIYETDKLSGQSKPSPYKSIFNLTTTVNRLKFNSYSQILAASSMITPNSMKLVRHFICVLPITLTFTF